MQPYPDGPTSTISELDIDRRTISIETRRLTVDPLLPIVFPHEASADADLIALRFVPCGESIEDFLVLGRARRELFIGHEFYCVL